jgi:hypothetical protein
MFKDKFCYALLVCKRNTNSTIPYDIQTLGAVVQWPDSLACIIDQFSGIAFLHGTELMRNNVSFSISVIFFF